MTATEAKAKFFVLLDEVAAGEEIEITKHGRTVARLVPARGPEAIKGKLSGVAATAAKHQDLFTTGELESALGETRERRRRRGALDRRLGD